MAAVDIDVALMKRVDIDALLTRVDINSMVGRIDVDSLVQNTELGGIIAKSTSGVASEALDVVRAQGVGLDGFVDRWMARLLRRDRSGLPKGPPLLVPRRCRRRRGAGGTPMTTFVPSGTGLGAAVGPDAQQLAVTRQGHYAGPVTRLVGYAVDQASSTGCTP